MYMYIYINNNNNGKLAQLRSQATISNGEENPKAGMRDCHRRVRELKQGT